MPLTDEERTQMKAAAKLEDMQLDGDLSNLSSVLDSILSVPDAAKTQPTDRAELQQLITAINAGTASNNQNARFLEIVNRLTS
jgi:hypothetical protein